MTLPLGFNNIMGACGQQVRQEWFVREEQKVGMCLSRLLFNFVLFIYFCLACFIFFLTLYCLIARFCFYHSKIKRETFLKKKTKCTSTNVNLDSHEPLGNGYIKMSNIKSICFISATPYDQIRFWNYKYCIPVQL